ncbi:MAG: type II secretion system F family protein [Steroidobacteraceae bacterium]|nr:type II secretion system F family protein [Steroidobacteraceae bacterium]
MSSYLPSIFAGLAGALAALLPFALKDDVAPSSERDGSWRDRLPAPLAALRPILQWYAGGVDRSLSPHQRDILQSRLNAAGAGYLLTPAEFIVLRRIALAAGCAAAMYLLVVLQIRDPMYAALAGLLAPLGYLYPNLWLRDASGRRQASFAKEFPFFLDILVLGMKAGLTFAAAVEQAVSPLCEGPVRQEFSRYLRETRTGVARRVALERLAQRMPIAAAINFAASVTQAEETGGSLGEVLADQARQRRQERFVRAEKLANQAPVKMLFPLIALLFPVTFIIIGFPIVIQLLDAGALDIF